MLKSLSASKEVRGSELREVRSYWFPTRIPQSLRSIALTVTPPVFAGGEYLPLPRSKGGAFPSLLTPGGCPTFSAKVAQEQGDPLKIGATLARQYLWDKQFLL
jgi:hypothetical protein